jgi:hypothetical protein
MLYIILYLYCTILYYTVLYYASAVNGVPSLRAFPHHAITITTIHHSQQPLALNDQSHCRRQLQSHPCMVHGLVKPILPLNTLSFNTLT